LHSPFVKAAEQLPRLFQLAAINLRVASEDFV
jgi:hypothetical protein